MLFGVVIRGPHLALLLAVLLYLHRRPRLRAVHLHDRGHPTFAFQAGLITSLLPAILLSGFVFQIRIMPGWLQVITYLIPARYFLVILRGIILKGEGLAPYWHEVAALVIYAGTAVTLASVRLARREG